MTNDVDGSAASDCSTVCSSCAGTGKVFASGIQYAPGATGPYCGEFRCNRCEGKGTISEDMVRWITQGKRMRADRLKRHLTLRDESQRLGISAGQLSAYEQGLVDNTALRSGVESIAD